MAFKVALGGEPTKGKAFKLGVGLVLLLTLLAIAAFLLKGSNQLGVATELLLTPFAFVPQTPFLWENVSLEQIRFSPPRVVLTDTFGLRIVGWISNNEVLILRDTLPGGKREAIEIFNVRKGAVIRLREGRIWGKPIWSSKERALAYLLYNEDKRVEELIWHPLEGDARLIESGVVQPVILAPEGRGAMAYAEGKLVGKLVGPPEKRVQVDFTRFAPPAPGCGWKYDTAVSPDGKWQVVYNCEHFLLVKTENGAIKELNLGDWVTDGAIPRWALEAQWSPDGQMLAVVATAGMLPNPVRFLLLLNPWGDELKAVSLPPGFPTEISWAPNSRFLLVQGVVETIPPGFELPGAILVDVQTYESREVKIYPQELLAGNIAWSPDGSLLTFLCRRFEEGRLGHIAICLSSVEVGK